MNVENRHTQLIAGANHTRPSVQWVYLNNPNFEVYNPQITALLNSNGSNTMPPLVSGYLMLARFILYYLCFSLALFL